MSVELHCHTVFSVDAYGTPEDLVDVAADRGVTTLSITEHDHLGSCQRAQSRATQCGIEYLPGIELGALLDDVELHLLGIGFDPDNSQMKSMVAESFSKNERYFDLYMPYLPEFGCHFTKEQMAVGLAERYPTHSAPVISQWFARDFLVDQGVYPDRAAFKAVIKQIEQRIIDEQGPQVFKSTLTLEKILKTIQGAGGVVLLAHVAYYYPTDQTKQIELIRKGLDMGLDGFELYHPLNVAESHFDVLIREAKQIGCVISGGSDCHNARIEGSSALNVCNVPEETIANLKSVLAERQLARM